MKPDELCHHGVKGMKWGERNGPPYPLTRASKFKQEIYEKKTGIRLPASRFAKRPETKAVGRLAKGTTVYHVTGSKDFDLNKQSEDPAYERLYAFNDSYDSSLYKGFFAAWRKGISKKPVYAVEMKLKEDLNLADSNTVRDVIRDEAVKSDAFRKGIANDVAVDIADHSFKPPSDEEHKGNIKWVYDSVIGKGPDSTKVATFVIQYGPYSQTDTFNTVIRALKEKGYNGLIDHNDQREKTGIIGARMPFVLLEPLRSAEVISVNELQDSEMVAHMRKLIESAE